MAWSTGIFACAARVANSSLGTDGTRVEGRAGAAAAPKTSSAGDSTGGGVAGETGSTGAGTGISGVGGTGGAGGTAAAPGGSPTGSRSGSPAETLRCWRLSPRPHHGEPVHHVINAADVIPEHGQGRLHGRIRALRMRAQGVHGALPQHLGYTCRRAWSRLAINLDVPQKVVEVVKEAFQGARDTTAGGYRSRNHI